MAEKVEIDSRLHENGCKSGWFTGKIVKRGDQPGIFVPRDRFHAKTETTLATHAKVVMVDDSTKYFTRGVAKVNTSQRIVHVPKYMRDVFIVGTKCMVCVIPRYY